MEQELQKKLEEQDAKLQAIYVSVEKTRKYFQVVMWVTVAMVVLPALGLMLVIPTFMSTYTNTFNSLEGL